MGFTWRVFVFLITTMKYIPAGHGLHERVKKVQWTEAKAMNPRLVCYECDDVESCSQNLETMERGRMSSPFDGVQWYPQCVTNFNLSAEGEPQVISRYIVGAVGLPFKDNCHCAAEDDCIVETCTCSKPLCNGHAPDASVRLGATTVSPVIAPAGAGDEVQGSTDKPRKKLCVNQNQKVVQVQQ